jgi:hypothetical protein
MRRHPTSNRRIGIGCLLLVAVGCGSDAAPPGDAKPISISAAEATKVEPSLERIEFWETVAGEWRPERVEGEPVLRQTAVDREYPVALIRDDRWGDIDVGVQFRPLSGQVDASGGIVFRATDGKNYYLVRGNSLEDNFRLYTVVAGKRTQIASTRVTAPALGRWHTLRVVAVGDRIQAYLNDELLIDHTDGTFSAGRTGLWTKADSVTEFRRLRITGTRR